MSDAERLLWIHLRSRQLYGFKFRRQMWLCGYIADFACAEAKLIVEADGGQHAERAEQDRRRSAAFAREGFRTLRFWNHDILENIDGVLAVIAEALPSPSHCSRNGPLSLPKWERENGAPAPLPLGEREGPAAKRWEGEGI